MFKHLAAACLALFFASSAGFAQNPPIPDGGTDTQAAAAAEPPRATIYVYRQKGFVLGGRTGVIFVDGKRLGILTYSGCIVAHVPAGDHKLQHRWDLLFDPTALLQKIGFAAHWEPGGTYYYRLSSGMAAGYPAKLEWSLEGVSPEVGRGGVGHCAGDVPIEFQPPQAAGVMPAIADGGERASF
jgi:hypothetical protein